MKRIILLPLSLIGAFVVASVFIFAMAEMEKSSVDYREVSRQNYMVFSPEVPSNASFSGEPAPLENCLVWESFDREILAYTYMHSSTLQMFKLAHRYFPVIEPILKAHHIPDDFKFLAIAESNLRNATSPSGAEGVWQFLAATARLYGLEVNAQIDERYNLKKATEAACNYLQKAYDTFGSWTLAAASYNRGVGGIQSALEHQKVKNYYDLYLNEETARYIFRILAAKEVWEHPTRYGFFLQESDFYPPVKTYTLVVDSTIEDLPDFALKQGLNYKVIREFNPWLHGYTLPNKSKRTYLLTLPVKGALMDTTRGASSSGESQIFHDTLTINDIRK